MLLIAVKHDYKTCRVAITHLVYYLCDIGATSAIIADVAPMSQRLLFLIN